MLRHTFCHLSGVGPRTEGRLWAAGLATWADALDPAKRRHARGARLAAADLHASHEQLDRANPAWFAERLPPTQLWRLFGDFRGACAYLDIETTGMAASDRITTIALYDGRSVRTYVRGQNLTDFVRDVQAYRLLVTYNGKCFDLPFLARDLGCPLTQAHLDLRYVLANLGIKGGLKGCERQLGLERPGLDGLDGFAAVLLWREYQRQGERRVLDTLLAYNVQDAVVLEELMIYAYNRHLTELDAPPWAGAYRLADAPPVTSPHRPDPEVVRRVAGANPWFAAKW